MTSAANYSPAPDDVTCLGVALWAIACLTGSAIRERPGTTSWQFPPRRGSRAAAMTAVSTRSIKAGWRRIVYPAPGIVSEQRDASQQPAGSVQRNRADRTARRKYDGSRRRNCKRPARYVAPDLHDQRIFCIRMSLQRSATSFAVSLGDDMRERCGLRPHRSILIPSRDPAAGSAPGGLPALRGCRWWSGPRRSLAPAACRVLRSDPGRSWALEQAPCIVEPAGWTAKLDLKANRRERGVVCSRTTFGTAVFAI